MDRLQRLRGACGTCCELAGAPLEALKVDGRTMHVYGQHRKAEQPGADVRGRSHSLVC